MIIFQTLMEKNWVKVYSSAQAYVVEIIKGLLESENITSHALNKTDSMHTHLYGEHELYVAREDVMRAKHIIQKNSL